MSVEYWIHKPCPECGCLDGRHIHGCRFTGLVFKESADKPLRWRTGYLPDDFSGEVIIEMYDGTHRIYDLGERERFGMKRMAYNWLPLSEILDLIGE